MRTYKPTKKVISGKQIYNHRRVEICMKFSYFDRTLIVGIVKNPEGEYIENAAVEVVLIDNSVNPNKVEVLGVVFTDEEGKYAVSVISSVLYSYKLNIYTPVP
ncbi:hypothetical protein [Tepidibacter sp. Z1-5]|uniref:hypothetical protein n=1 Tax=Tepidibacter sp. Z1-5 TaxID=3134138 RepID=UPI0030C568B8